MAILVSPQNGKWEEIVVGNPSLIAFHSQSDMWINLALNLALGIGANAGIFSVVRGVLPRPQATRDEHRLLYVRQSAPGRGLDNATFSIPEIRDIGSGLKNIHEVCGSRCQGRPGASPALPSMSRLLASFLPAQRASRVDRLWAAHSLPNQIGTMSSRTLATISVMSSRCS
jgi:hypothetical protein